MEPGERKRLAEEMERDVLAVLTKYKDILGPETDDEGGLCRCGSDPCPCRVPAGYTPTEYILVSNWTDFEASGMAGHDWMDTTPSLGMRRSQTIGLLQMSLDGARQIRMPLT